MLEIGLTGITGRMGRALLKTITMVVDKELRLSAAVHRPDSTWLGSEVSDLIDSDPTGVTVVGKLDEANFDLLIDFSFAAATMENVEYCQLNNKAMIIGTTGFDANQKQEIADASQSIPIVLAPNMSVGVNLCFHLLKQTAAVLGNESDIEIFEAHHRNKLDAPSGTALQMGEVIANSLGRDLQQCAVYDRQDVKQARDKNTIGFATVRAGDIVGEHTALFAAEGERIEISHKASNRQIYANGALRAARWLIGKPSGLYDMQDVLGLN